MPNNSDELIVAGDGQVYVADVGTTLPTSPTASLAAGFSSLGYHTEDGLSFSASPDISEFMAWQSRQAIRRELNAQELQLQFVLQQFNEVTVPLAFGGGEVTSVSGGYRYDFPSEGDALDERAMVADVIDGDDVYRFVFPRGNVVEAVESQFNRSATGQLPIAFKALEPTDGSGAGYLLTNAESFADGS